MLRVASARALLSALLLARSAAADERALCVDAATAGQVERDRGGLLAARAHFLTCAQDSCPAVVSTACARWLAQVDERIPSVVFRVEDGRGRDRGDASVSVDGRLVPDASNGRPVRLDPGAHTVRMEARGARAAEVSITLADGEKSRLIVGRLGEEPPAAAPPSRARGVGAPAWILAGAGVTALGVSGYLGLTGINDASALRDSCGRSCPDGDRSELERRFLAADVLLGAGLLALGGALYLWLASSER
ncbi:MAG: hypothetical protein U0270_39345 [Labilithrix sp.]